MHHNVSVCNDTWLNLQEHNNWLCHHTNLVSFSDTLEKMGEPITNKRCITKKVSDDPNDKKSIIQSAECVQTTKVPKTKAQECSGGSRLNNNNVKYSEENSCPPG